MSRRRLERYRRHRFRRCCPKLNDVDPQAWPADVLSRIAAHPAQRLGELLPWNWKPTSAASPSLDAAA